MANVVPIANIGEVKPCGGTEVLLECHEIGESLAWMLKVGERVDNRHPGIGSHLSDGVMRIGAQDDHIDPPLHVSGYVGNRFAFTKRRVGLIDKDCVAAHGVDASLECEP